MLSWGIRSHLVDFWIWPLEILLNSVLVGV